MRLAPGAALSELEIQGEESRAPREERELMVESFGGSDCATTRPLSLRGPGSGRYGSTDRVGLRRQPRQSDREEREGTKS